MTKTGTTICGVIFNDGVVLGCDTRTTNGNVIWEKCCEKIYKIQNHIYGAGCGSAGDMEYVVKWMQANLTMHQLNTNRKKVPVQCAVTTLKQMYFENGGSIRCHFIIGGYDFYGPHISLVYAQGATMKLPYATMGSGSYAAMSILESRWKPDMNESDAKELVADAITAGIMNDLGSGSNVDLCVIRKNSAEKLYAVRKVCVSGKKILDYKVKAGTTGVTSKLIKEIELDIVEEKIEKMEI